MKINLTLKLMIFTEKIEKNTKRRGKNQENNCKPREFQVVFGVRTSDKK